MKQNKIYLSLLFLICFSFANCKKSVQDQSVQTDQDTEKETRRKEELKWYLAVRSNPEGHGYIKSGYDELMKSDVVKYPNGNKEIAIKKLLEKFEVYLNPALKRMYCRRLSQNNSRISSLAMNPMHPYYIQSYSCICSGVAIPVQTIPLADDESCVGGAGDINTLEFAEDFDFFEPFNWYSNAWGEDKWMHSATYGTFSLLEYNPAYEWADILEEMDNVISETPDGWVAYGPL